MSKEEAFEEIVRLANLTDSDIGTSEENVKVKFLLPMLKALGHIDRFIDCEHTISGKRIDVFLKDLPKRCTVFFDTKKYGENHYQHLGQLEGYARNTGALIAGITNGQKLDLFCPRGGCTFVESLLYSFDRKELMNKEVFENIYNILSREQLTSSETRKHIRKRADEVHEQELEIENLEQELKKEQELFYKLTSEHKNKMAEISEKFKELKKTLPYESKNIFVIPQRIEPNISTSKRRSGTRASRAKGMIISEYQAEIELPSNWENGWKRYNLIRIPYNIRRFFPGYKEDFELSTDINRITTKVTSAPGGVERGDPNEGGYFSHKGIRKWYEKHQELSDGDVLVFTKEGDRTYRLTIKGH